MNSQTEVIKDNFIEAAGELSHSLSISRIVGQLYALLYLSKESVSLDELANRLKISKGNASVNIRILEQWGAVKKNWVRGSRKDYYTANPDLGGIIINRLKEGLSKRMDKTIDVLVKIKEELNKNKNHLDKEGKKTMEFYEMRLKQIEELYSLVEKNLKFLPKLSFIKQVPK